MKSDPLATRLTFHFRPVLSAAALIALIILFSLGNWQLQRRAWKLDLIEQTQARVAAAPIPMAEALARDAAGENMEYAPVRLEGVYLPEKQARLVGLYEGEPGFYYFTALTTPLMENDLGKSGVVFINRGFAPDHHRAPKDLVLDPASGPVVVEGLLRKPERVAAIAGVFRPPENAAENLWYTRDPQRFSDYFSVRTTPYYIDSFGVEADAPWPKGRVTRLEFNNRHMEYALTWFGLGGALIAVYLAFSLRRR